MYQTEFAFFLFGETIKSCVDWFVQILESVDGVEYYIAGLIFVLSVTYFLFPLFSTNPRSDRARKVDDDE